MLPTRTSSLPTNRFTEWHTYDVRSKLNQISCPTLVLHGAKDCVFPIESTHEMCDQIRSELLQFQLLEECGHALLTDDPARVLQLIETFAEP
ncbi:MAG: alpha/beta hydrolase [Pseudobdellovibrionaceae bacterium]